VIFNGISDMKEHIKIFTGNSILINRIVSLLDENNIPSLIRDNEESGRLAGFGVPQNSVELFVYRSDVDEAQKIIDALDLENEMD
jgi:hypothetical protein